MLRFYSSCVQKGSGAAPQPTSRNLTHVTSWCATHRQQDVGRLQVRGGGVGVGGVKGGSQRATVTIDWRRSSGMNYDLWCIPERAEPRETWDVDSHFFLLFTVTNVCFFFSYQKSKWIQRIICVIVDRRPSSNPSLSTVFQYALKQMSSSVTKQHKSTRDWNKLIIDLSLPSSTPWYQQWKWKNQTFE